MKGFSIVVLTLCFGCEGAVKSSLVRSCTVQSPLASVGTAGIAVVVAVAAAAVRIAVDSIVAVGGRPPGSGNYSVRPRRAATVVPVETETRESSFAMPISFFEWVLVRVLLLLLARDGDGVGTPLSEVGPRSVAPEG